MPILSVLFAFAGKPIFTMFLFRLWNRTNEHLVTYLNLCLQVVFLTCEIYIGLYNLCNFNVAISIISHCGTYDRCGDWIEIISQSIYLKDCVV